MLLHQVLQAVPLGAVVASHLVRFYLICRHEALFCEVDCLHGAYPPVLLRDCARAWHDAEGKGAAGFEGQ